MLKDYARPFNLEALRPHRATVQRSYWIFCSPTQVRETQEKQSDSPSLLWAMGWRACADAP